MATIVNMHQAKASLSRLVERALAGEEVIIGRNGEPLIQLVPVAKTRALQLPDGSQGQAERGSGSGVSGEDIAGSGDPPPMSGAEARDKG